MTENAQCSQRRIKNMWGIALSLNPRNWRLGAVDALDHDISGREIVVGRWYFFGPLAVTYDYQ